MATQITVTLEANQVQQALVYARQIKPDATNEELIAELEDAAYWGPGVREVIASWQALYIRAQEQAGRVEAQTEFLEDFPAKPEPDPEPEPPAPENLPAASGTKRKK